jgi:hypothetical protein
MKLFYILTIIAIILAQATSRHECTDNTYHFTQFQQGPVDNLSQFEHGGQIRIFERKFTVVTTPTTFVNEFLINHFSLFCEAKTSNDDISSKHTTQEGLDNGETEKGDSCTLEVYSLNKDDSIMMSIFQLNPVEVIKCKSDLEKALVQIYKPCLDYKFMVLERRHLQSESDAVETPHYQSLKLARVLELGKQMLKVSGNDFELTKLRLDYQKGNDSHADLLQISSTETESKFLPNDQSGGIYLMKVSKCGICEQRLRKAILEINNKFNVKDSQDVSKL